MVEYANNVMNRITNMAYKTASGEAIGVAAPDASSRASMRSARQNIGGIDNR